MTDKNIYIPKKMLLFVYVPVFSSYMSIGLSCCEMHSATCVVRIISYRSRRKKSLYKNKTGGKVEDIK